ncbi:MAG: PulJ/GspJ family protein [Lacipirellulaceae bacterium]
MNRTRTSRRGYTLVELLMASAASTALVGGLASAIYVSSKALDPGNGASARRTAADRAAAAILSDAQHALCYTERTATALTLKVPDRTDDDQPETIRYAWGGAAGDPLTRSVNGGAAIAVAPDVRALALTTDERISNADDVTIPKNVPWPIVRDTRVTVRDPAGTTVSVNRPTGTTAGDLLLAAIAVNGNRTGSLVAAAGFSLIDLNAEDNTVTLGLYWKVATNAEPATHTFSWSGSDRAVAWVMRITNQDGGNPITTFATANGASAAAECAATGTSIDQSLVVRIGAFNGASVTPGVTGLSGHTEVLMNAAASQASGGCGWKVQRRAGDCGQAAFALTGTQPFRTVTVVVAPKVN